MITILHFIFPSWNDHVWNLKSKDKMVKNLDIKNLTLRSRMASVHATKYRRGVCKGKMDFNRTWCFYFTVLSFIVNKLR